MTDKNYTLSHYEKTQIVAQNITRKQVGLPALKLQTRTCACGAKFETASHRKCPDCIKAANKENDADWS